MTTTPALSAVGLRKRFGRRVVLDDVDFHADAGEVVAVIGENGAGKTTLLRLCAGLLAPDAGTVVHAGRIGYCPQDPGVVELLSADQHLALFAGMSSARRAQAYADARRVLTSLGFPATNGLPVKDLSGGTRQKLNLALALLGDPPVLLLDEPYQGFDMGAYVDFWHHVDQWRDEGRAVVIVTHLLTELHRVDRVVEVRDGGAEIARTVPR